MEVFRDQVVIITGASRGIGYELALQLAAQGARLALAARDETALDAVVAVCRSQGAPAIAVVTDVSDETACDHLITATVRAYGRIDMLINNAGITMWSRFDALEDLSVLERLMAVNYLGSAYCTAHALPYLKQSRGRIVGVSSLAGKTGIPTRSGYAASKHAMAGFFDSLRIELAPQGVSVTMIYPGFVASEVRGRAFGPNGQPLGHSPVRESDVMPAATCAARILQAAAVRKREEVMTVRGKLGLWLKLVAPTVVDRVARQAIKRGR